jgi:hemerythrin-like domain-containing protein
MTTTTNSSNLPDLNMYRLIHRLLREGAHRLADGVTELDLADRHQVRAFGRYWRGYAGEVKHHHTVEDVIVFPALAERVPGGAVALTSIDGDHHHLDVLSVHIEREIARVERGRSISRLHALLIELSDHMDEHLDVEDRELLPLIEEHFNRQEYAALEDRIPKEVPLGKQALFTVPFVMAGATPEEGVEILATAPSALRMVYRMTRRGHEKLRNTAFPRTVAAEAARRRETGSAPIGRLEQGMVA